MNLLLKQYVSSSTFPCAPTPHCTHTAITFNIMNEFMVAMMICTSVLTFGLFLVRRRTVRPKEVLLQTAPSIITVVERRVRV